MEKIEIPKSKIKEFQEEYQTFQKWASCYMTRSEFIGFLLIQNRNLRLRHRPTWLFYFIDTRKIGILDRKNGKKIIVKRIHDYLLCEKDNEIACLHCNFCLNDKEVKKSLHPKYVKYVRQAFKPKIKWPKLKGQKLNFDKIIGNKTFVDAIPTGDYSVEF